MPSKAPASSFLVLASLTVASHAFTLPSYVEASSLLPSIFQRAAQVDASTANTANATTSLTTMINQTQTQNTTTGVAGSISTSPSGNGTVNCSDPITGIGDNCFQQLQLADYVRDWVSSHECNSGEPFSTCYFRLSGLGALYCNSITVNGCTPPPISVLDPQAYYTAYTIYAINNYLTSWWIAVGQGSQETLSNIGEIAALIAPNNATRGESVMSSSLGRLTRQIQSNLNQTVISVLSNATEFSAFASQGNFSVASSNLLAEASNYLFYAFNTYVATNLLNGVGIYATIGKNTNIRVLATNGTTLAYPIDCSSYDTNNVCDTFYYSISLQSTFGLINSSAPQQNLGLLTATLLSNYTTGPLLFDAAYECSSSGASNGPVNVTVTAAGVNTACIGALPVYTWDMTCHTDPNASGDADKNCEFLEKSKEAGFWVDQGGARQVPAAYMGPAVAQDKFKISRGS